jgi:AcrR family transcriptional regulator
MPGNPSRDRGAEVRRKIEQAAVELVGEVGWGGVSTRLLAERAGVTPGLVHYHYRSLDDALRTAITTAVEAMIAEFEQRLAGETDPQRLMAAAWAALDDFSATGPQSVMIIEAVLAAIRDVELRQRLAAIVGRYRQLLTERLGAAGVEHPEATAAVLAAVVDGVMLHRILFEDLDSAAVEPVVARMVAREVTA